MFDDDDLAERVRRLESKVSQLYAILNRAEPTSDDPREMSDEVRALVQSDQMIEAIKLHREQTGLGLAEAKAAVERAGLTG